MKVNRYTQKFENETTGSRYRRSFSVIYTIAAIALVVSASFVFSRSNVTTTEFIDLQQKTVSKHLKGADSSPSSVPTNIPSLSEFFMTDEEYYDDVEKYIRRKSKYPTHHPKRKTQAPSSHFSPSSPQFSPIYSVESSIYPTINTPTTESSTLHTTISSTISATESDTISATESASLSPTPMVVIATDDFHVTPIVVINTEETNKTTQSNNEYVPAL